MAVFFKESIKGPLIRVLAALSSGILLTASFPKTGLAYLAWFAFLPLLFSIRNKSWWTAFKLGLVAGLAHNLTLVYWTDGVMRHYGGLDWYASFPLLLLLSLYLSLYVALFAGFVRRGSDRPLVHMILAPALWVALEYARTFLVTGFPWGLLAHTQFENLAIIQFSDITGAYGVSALIIAVNFSIYLFATSLFARNLFGAKVSPIKGLAAIVATGLLFGGAWLYGQHRISQVEEIMAQSQSQGVSVIQGNIDQNIKWNPAYQQHTVDTYMRLTKEAVNEDTELVVWPESAMPFYFSATEPFLTAQVLKTARENNVFLITGSMSFERPVKGTKFYNSAYLIGPNGKITGRYDKVHLVPWGEYVPLKKYMPFIDNLVEQVSDFSPGKKGQALSANGTRLGVLICYEIIFPNLARHQVLEGANLLLTITNDAWFGKSSAPYQHFSMAVFRAVETRRSVARAANTGISGFIDPAGRIMEPTGLFVEAHKSAKLPIVNHVTPYTKLGDFFAMGCVVLALILLVFGRKKAE